MFFKVVESHGEIDAKQLKNAAKNAIDFELTVFKVFFLLKSYF